MNDISIHGWCYVNSRLASCSFTSVQMRELFKWKWTLIDLLSFTIVLTI